jgi:hypothetical protein
MDACDVCGQVVRQRCSQGHPSTADASFCQTCGEFLVPIDSGPAAGSGTPATEYTTGSFADLITRMGDQVPGDDPPHAPSFPLSTAGDQQEWDPDWTDSSGPPPPGAWPGSARDGSTGPLPVVPQFYAAPPAAPPAPSAWQAAAPPPPAAAWRAAPAQPASPVLAPAAPAPHRSTPAPDRPPRLSRTRVLALVAGCAVVAAVVIAGAVAVSHRQPGQAASPGPGAATGGQSGPSAGPPPVQTSPAAPDAPRWSAPLPVGRPNRSPIDITGISCPQSSLCYTVGQAGEVMESNAMGWWREAASDKTRLVAISCGTGQFCLALDAHGDALIYRHGSWGKPLYIDARKGTFTAVSCSGASFCMAADSGGNAFAYSPSGWTPFSVDTTGGGLAGVSCPAPQYCVAVDTGGGAYLYNGHTWTNAVGVDRGHAFTGVSCPSTSFCLGAIEGGKAALFQGGKWTVASMPATATAVDCPTSGFCAAVTGDGRAMFYRSHAWSRPQTIDGKAQLSGVSCSKPRVCVAGGHDGMAIYFR